MEEVLRAPNEFSTFNEFFIRQLKPDARPINKEPYVITSPADGKVIAFAGMDGLDTFFTKGQKFSLRELLQEDSLVSKYEEGTLLIIRLAPADYHRFHFPADGRISPSRLINGTYYSVSAYVVKKRMKTFWENKREFSLLHTDNTGDILLCEIGATMMGAIVQSYLPETTVKKGQEKGWFSFGGSTVIMLFEKGKITVDHDIIQNTKNGYETSIKMGARLAIALKNHRA